MFSRLTVAVGKQAGKQFSTTSQVKILFKINYKKIDGKNFEKYGTSVCANFHIKS